MLLKLMAFVQAYKNDLKGATAIEYGLIAGGISLAIVTAVFLFGDNLSALFDTIAAKMGQAATDSGATVTP